MNFAAWRKLDQWISRILPSGKRVGGGILHEELHQKDADTPWHVWGTQGMQTSADWIEWWLTGGFRGQPVKAGCAHNSCEKYN